MNEWQTRGPPPPASPGLGQHRVHKQEDGFLWGQLDALPDDIHELGHRDVRGQQILPLVDVQHLRPRRLLHNHLSDHSADITTLSATTRPPFTLGPLTGTRSGYLLRILADSKRRCSGGQMQKKKKPNGCY